MDGKEIMKENLKYVLYTIFDNYGDLSKKIYIIIGGKQNNTQIVEYVLKKINQNTPAFIRKILIGYNDSDSSITKLKRVNQNIEIVNKNELDEKNAIIIDIFNIDFKQIQNMYSYESKFVVDYILSLDEIGKSRFFKKLNEGKKEDSDVVIDANDKSEKNQKKYLNLNDLYNICIEKTLWKNGDDISKMINWIYNTINPNVLHDDLFEQMLNTINEQLDNSKFNSYLEYILSKKENKCIEYISPLSNLYHLLLFEDMLRIDYKDKCNVRIDLDVDYIGEWWSENILPLFKKKYDKGELANQLQLEVKKNEIIDFHGKNFEKLKNKIIEEIEKEYSQTEILQENFEQDEKTSIEKNINQLNFKNISELEQELKNTQIKYENNKEILKNYCSDKFIDLLENKERNYNLKELEQFLKNNEEYFNNKVFVYFEVCIQKEIQKLEENLLNDVCDVKDLKGLQELHNKLLENGEFVKCEDLENIIFRKMESIIKTLNLAEINDENNISIANSIYNNTSSIELEKYPVAEILICRDINIDLNNAINSIEDLKYEIDEIKQVVSSNCIFNCEYYNMNIQINESENYYSIKFKYLNDLVDYIRLKEGNGFLLSLRNMNKDAKYKKRVFNKGNSEIIKEIDDFYLEKQTAKN